MDKHPCMSCKERLATVKLTKLVNGGVEELFLCQDCAARQSPYQKKISAVSLDQILAGILGQNKEEAAAKPGSVDLSCSTCGLPFDSYRSTLLLGCSDCYESFEQQLTGDLRKFHGSTVHRGRVPEDVPESFQKQRNPQELRKRLSDAVKAEDFELAAKLRDELRSVEQTGGVE